MRIDCNHCYFFQCCILRWTATEAIITISHIHQTSHKSQKYWVCNFWRTVFITEINKWSLYSQCQQIYWIQVMSPMSLGLNPTTTTYDVSPFQYDQTFHNSTNLQLRKFLQIHHKRKTFFIQIIYMLSLTTSPHSRDRLLLITFND